MKKFQMKSLKSRQSGNAILFTLLAMVIGGVVVAVGITQYQDADRAAQIQGAVAEVNSIIGNAKQNYGQYSYANLSTAVAVGSRVIPPNLAVLPAGGGGGATTALNKFRGAINLVASATASSADLTYAQVPSEICTALVNGTQGLADNITVGGTAVKTPGGVVQIGTLNTSCTAGAVDIVWTFGRT
jgi:PilS N terminal